MSFVEVRKFPIKIDDVHEYGGVADYKESNANKWYNSMMADYIYSQPSELLEYFAVRNVSPRKFHTLKCVIIILFIIVVAAVG